MRKLNVIKWILLILGVLVLGYSIYAYYQISGFKLLEANSTWGYIYAVSYRVTFIIAFLLIIFGTILIALNRKFRDKKAEDGAEN